jgi:hypothetical protein
MLKCRHDPVPRRHESDLISNTLQSRPELHMCDVIESQVLRGIQRKMHWTRDEVLAFTRRSECDSHIERARRSMHVVALAEIDYTISLDLASGHQTITAGDFQVAQVRFVKLKEEPAKLACMLWCSARPR